MFCSVRISMLRWFDSSDVLDGSVSASSWCSALLSCKNFLTCEVLREYCAPSCDCTTRLFPRLVTSVYGVGLNWVESLSCLSCCTSTWSPGTTSE